MSRHLIKNEGGFTVEGIKDRHEYLKKQDNYDYADSLECKQKEFLLNHIEYLSGLCNCKLSLTEETNEVVRP